MTTETVSDLPAPTVHPTDIEDAPGFRSWWSWFAWTLFVVLRGVLACVVSWCATMGAGLTLMAMKADVYWCVVPMTVVGLVAAAGAWGLLFPGEDE